MAKHELSPHLARLDRSNLEVRYRASEQPQVVKVQVHGTPKAGWDTDSHVRMTEPEFRAQPDRGVARVVADGIRRAAARFRLRLVDLSRHCPPFPHRC